MADDAPTSASKPAWHQLWWNRLWWLLPALVALVAYRESPEYGYIGDARFLLETNQQMLDPGGWWPAISRDFFDSSSGNHIPYWRPWTKLSWWLETQLFGLRPGVFHSFQVLWWAAGSVAAAAAARALGAGRAAAALAGSLVALAAPAVEASCLIMARSDVTAAAASLVALACALAQSPIRDPGQPGDQTQQTQRGLRLVQLVAVVVATLSKESAVVVAPLLAAHAALAVHWRGADLRAAARAALVQSGPELVAIAVALTARKLVLGSDTGTALALDPLRIFVSGGQYMLAALPLQLRTDLRSLTPAEAKSAGWLVQSGLAWLGALGFAGWLIRRRSAGGLLVYGWGLATLAPVLLVADLNVPGATGAFAVADRWALPLAAALAVVLMAEVGGALRPAARRVLGATIAVWCLGAIGVAASLHSPYRDELTILELEDRGFANTPAAFRTVEDGCRAVDRLVVRAIAHKEWQQVLEATAGAERCPDQVSRAFNRISALVSLGRWSEARAACESLLQVPSADTRHLAQLHHLHAKTLLHTSEARGALAALDRALGAGLRSCGLLADRAAALDAVGAREEAAQMREMASACAASGAPSGRR